MQEWFCHLFHDHGKELVMYCLHSILQQHVYHSVRLVTNLCDPLPHFDYNLYEHYD